MSGVLRGNVLDNVNKEAAQLVDLCADQVTAAVAEAQGEIAGLTAALLDAAEQTQRLSATTDDGTIQTKVQHACSRLQFADRLSQRLANVSSNLGVFADLLRTTPLPLERAHWNALLDTMQANFTMADERLMFRTAFDAAMPLERADAQVDSAPGSDQGVTLFEQDFGND